MAPGLKGSGFIGGWSGATLWSSRTSRTPPCRRMPGPVVGPELNDVIAFILQSNDYPAGADELAVDLANQGDPIRIE